MRAGQGRRDVGPPVVRLLGAPHGLLSYSPETGEVWTLTDPIPERVLYAVRLSDVDSALS